MSSGFSHDKCGDRNARWTKIVAREDSEKVRNILEPLGISPADLAIEQIEILTNCTKTHKEEIERRAGAGAVAMYSGVSTLLHKPVGPVSGIILFLFENQQYSL